LKKLIFIILQTIIILYFVVFLSNNSFIISFAINDFIFSTSSNYLFIIFIIFFLIVFLTQSLYFKSKFSFFKFITLKQLKKKEKGYSSFVNGMLALANKDYKKAIQQSNSVSNYLKDNSSLSLLLKSEVFKIEKKYIELNLVYEEMIKNESTKNLGFRGLMEQYLRSQDYHHAFIYGEKLFNNNPYIEKIYETLVNIISKTNNWQQLLVISDRAYSKKIIDLKKFQENKSIAFYEIAKIKRLGDSKDATNYALKALNLRKGFPPYIILYIELLIEDKKHNSAKKLLRKAWSDNPHPHYKSLLSKLSENLQINFSELVQYIVGSSSNQESKVLKVEASIKARKWDVARSQIKSLLDVHPSKEVCLLMVKIEDGDSSDIQKINAWTLRSKNGIENSIWVCSISNNSQEYWSSTSDAGYFNSLQWKKPSILNFLNV